jgi:acetaldehyde dehydrogenase/alcohol dehydrogenase
VSLDGHKLGAEFGLAHGLANALIANVIRYNANDVPSKQAAFSQYDRPVARCRYAEIADALALGGVSVDEKVEALVAWIEELKQWLNIPGVDSGGGCARSAIPRVSRRARKMRLTISARARIRAIR